MKWLVGGILVGSVTILLCACISTAFGAPPLAQPSVLRTSLEKIALQAEGRLGICALPLDAPTATCVNGDQAFSMQSVMKLIVAAAVMEASVLI